MEKSHKSNRDVIKHHVHVAKRQGVSQVEAGPVPLHLESGMYKEFASLPGTDNKL
jgi:hypothetical protein